MVLSGPVRRGSEKGIGGVRLMLKFICDQWEVDDYRQCYVCRHGFVISQKALIIGGVDRELAKEEHDWGHVI